MSKKHEAGPECRAVRLNALQEPPFFTVVVGPRKSGKTFWTVRCLRDTNAYAGTFQHLVLMSPTLFIDWTWGALDTDHDSIELHDSFSLKVIDELFERCYKRKERGEHTLLVVDDSVANAEFRDYTASKKEHPLTRIAIHGRHRNLSCIVLTQKLRLLSSSMRANCDQGIFFRATNGTEFQVGFFLSPCHIIFFTYFRKSKQQKEDLRHPHPTHI